MKKLGPNPAKTSLASLTMEDRASDWKQLHLVQRRGCSCRCQGAGQQSSHELQSRSGSRRGKGHQNLNCLSPDARSQVEHETILLLSSTAHKKHKGLIYGLPLLRTST